MKNPIIEISGANVVTERRKEAIFGKSLIAVIVVGGVLYLAARYFPQPQWVYDFFKWLSPVIVGITTAERVAIYFGHPVFPAQMIIFYGAFGSIAWAVWFFYLFWKIRDSMAKHLSQYRQELLVSKKPSFLGFSIGTVFAGVLSFLGYRVAFFSEPPIFLTWRHESLFSGGLSSFSFAMFVIAFFSIVVPYVFIFIFLFLKTKGFQSV